MAGGCRAMASTVGPPNHKIATTNCSDSTLREPVACALIDQRCSGGAMDQDLELMTHAQLVDEVRRLRNGIRAHRDSTGQELCWHHPALWSLLPASTDPV